MAQVELYSTVTGQNEKFDLEVDQNGEIVATHEEETLKFPAGLTKAQFNKLVDRHNKANEGVVARSPEELEEEEKAREQSEKLLEEL